MTGPADTHRQLEKMWGAGIFEPSIHHIRFPVFKNLEQGMRINFDHPVTALVGPNGTNKTAILRALQGAPGGNDLGTYWFGTAVDAIDYQQRHRFIYGRHSPTTGSTVEVIKTRIGRRNSKRSNAEIDPDLFEPSRPLLRPPDSMERYEYDSSNIPVDGKATRWDPIDKNVLYLDFRAQLSAFDRAFHHSNPMPGKSAALTLTQLQNIRKKRLRLWAPRLASAIEQLLKSDVKHGTQRIIEPVRDLGPVELQWVRAILGRDYSSVSLIHHRYFDRTEGFTAVLRADGLAYSEAFAGSGEFAVVMLVTQVLAAVEKTLILLDEPEVSLHPGAQRKLMEFLSEMSKLHKHQVVLATHSPELVRDLPPSAVKVLTLVRYSGKIDLPSQASSPLIAFGAVGAAFEKPTIIVEDRLAEELVKRAIANEALSDAVTVHHIPGGADVLWTHYLSMWAHEGRSNLLLLLDGDQRCAAPPPESTIADDSLEKALEACMNERSPKLPYGSDEDGSEDRRNKAMRRVIEWRRKHVGFLPCDTPEEFLWQFRVPFTSPKETEPADEKERWRLFVEEQMGKGNEISGSDILTLQRVAMNSVPYVHQDLQTIRDLVQPFVSSQAS